jgi:hypothetical protein
MKKTLLFLLFAAMFLSGSAKADTSTHAGNAYISFTTSLTGSALDNPSTSLLRDYRVDSPRIGRKSRFRQLQGDHTLRSPLAKRPVRRVIQLFNPFSRLR